MKPRIAIFVFALLGLAFLTSSVDACPTCKESLAEDGGNLVRGYFWSILFMMSMPFLIVAGLGSLFYLEVRRARAARASGNVSARAAEHREPCTVGGDY